MGALRAVCGKDGAEAQVSATCWSAPPQQAPISSSDGSRHWPLADRVGLWACIRDEMWDILRLSCHQLSEATMFVQGALTNERGILRRVDGPTLPATWTHCACILHVTINHLAKNTFIAHRPFCPLQWRVRLRFTATAQPPLWPKLCHRL